MEQEKNNRKIQEAVEAVLEQKKDAIQDAIQRTRLYEEWWLEKLERNKHKTEVINRAMADRGVLQLDKSWEIQEDALEREAEARAELLEKYQEAKLAEMERLLEAQLG
jgi:predicted GNAT superfamily acetyltransferase